MKEISSLRLVLLLLISTGLLFHSGNTQSVTPTKVYLKLLPSKRALIGHSGLAAILRRVKDEIHTTVENLYNTYGDEVSGMNPSATPGMGSMLSEVISVSNQPEATSEALPRFEQVRSETKNEESNLQGPHERFEESDFNGQDRTESELQRILDEENEIKNVSRKSNSVTTTEPIAHEIAPSRRGVQLTIDKASIQPEKTTRFEQKRAVDLSSTENSNTIEALTGDTSTSDDGPSIKNTSLEVSSPTFESYSRGLRDGPISPAWVRNNASDDLSTSIPDASSFFSNHTEVFVRRHV